MFTYAAELSQTVPGRSAPYENQALLYILIFIKRTLSLWMAKYLITFFVNNTKIL